VCLIIRFDCFVQEELIVRTNPNLLRRETMQLTYNRKKKEKRIDDGGENIFAE
jgi:hypothetical protein